VSVKSFRRRLRFCFFRLRLGKLRLLLGLIVFAAAVAFHLTIATYLADQQPGDSRVYIQLARNVVEQGVFSVDATPPYNPTLIRMPGYPFFLIGVYEINGLGNETAVRITQALLFSLTCIVVAMIASQWVDRSRKFRAALAAFILAAFCPFMAIYSATILTEMLTMFLLAAMLLAATYAVGSRKRLRSGFWWGVAGILGGLNVLSRPDSGLFAFGIGLTLVFSIFWGDGLFTARLKDRFWKGIIFTMAFILPLAPWTVRNERLFGVFQPLAPTHAEMPGEFVPRGYLLWLRTWIDDSKYIDPLIWRLEQKPLRIEDVPAYAFSSDEEKQKIAALFDLYNNSDPDHPAVSQRKVDSADSDDNDDKDSASDDNSSDIDDGDDNDKSDDGSDDNSDSNEELNLKITPDVDAAFAEIASERVAREPYWYYLWLPAKRSASMWFDTHSDSYPFNGELFPLTDLDKDENQQIWLPLFAGLNLIYTALSFAGALVLLLIRKACSWLWLFLVLAISLPRITFFGTIENPEPRYFVELFIPAAILGGVFLAFVRFRRASASVGIEINYSEEQSFENSE
jgi:hypothetical protein